LDGTKPHLTADTVESPLPGNRHGGFGERPGETDHEQSRHGAPGRLKPIMLVPRMYHHGAAADLVLWVAF
jgi:hypothetical protein